MSDSLEDYLNSLSLLPIVQQNDSLVKRISNLQDRLANKTFQLVILGQFKRGKTSLINALFGENLLPTAIVPLTSIVTIIKYGKKEKITVTFLDGRKKEINHEELSGYITESENPENKKEVEKVIFEYPSDFLKKGVEVIDTPGVGSVYKHNTDVAYEFVPKADAGIFVVTADPPISQSELQFLQAIKNYLAKIIFVQNKIDQVSEKDLELSLAFTRKVIEKAAGAENLNFYQISAKLGLEAKKEKNKQKLTTSRLDILENGLNTLLTHKKDHFLKISVANKLLSLVNEIELELNIEKQALQMTAAKLKEKTEAFRSYADSIKQEKEDDSFILTGQAEKLTKQVLIDDIEALKEKELQALFQKFDLFFQNNKKRSGDELTKAFDNFLKQSIKNIFTSWRKEEEQKLQTSLKTIINRFSNSANQYIQKIIDLSSNLFNLKLTKFQVDSTLTSEIEFRFSFDEYPVEIEVFTPIVSKLPRFISHHLLYNKMKDDLFQQFDAHCGRVRYDFTQRILKSVEEYRHNLDGALNQIIIGIEKTLAKTLSEKESKKEYQNKTNQEIEKQEKVLAKIKNRLKSI